MKISSILQIKESCILLLYGFIIGLIYSIINIKNKSLKHIKIQNIIDSLYIPLSFIIYIYITLKLNLNSHRAFLLFGYLLGFTIEQLSIDKMIAKLNKIIYTTITSKFKNSIFIRKIFK